jgi:hypothetical protein
VKDFVKRQRNLDEAFIYPDPSLNTLGPFIDQKKHADGNYEAPGVAKQLLPSLHGNPESDLPYQIRKMQRDSSLFRVTKIIGRPKMTAPTFSNTLKCMIVGMQILNVS